MTTQAALKQPDIGAAPPSPPREIYRLMPLIMGEIKAVTKGKENKQQGYSFRGYDDVYLACKAIMAKHGVFPTHRILEQVWGERTTSKGGTMLHVRALFAVEFWASDGSCVETQVIGEAMDSGDKAANKAMSMAMKYALVDTFLIPTGEPRDTENGSPDITKPMDDGQYKQIEGLFNKLAIAKEARAGIVAKISGKSADDVSYTDAAKIIKALTARIESNKAAPSAAKQGVNQ